VKNLHRCKNSTPFDMETLPIPRTTLADMVNAYVLSEQEIRTDGLLVQASSRLRLMFADPERTYAFDLRPRASQYSHGVDYEKPQDTMKEVKKEVWRHLVQRMELRRILSIKRSEELDKQIETGEGLPDVTMEGLLGMIEGTLGRAGMFIEEAVREVFEWLRPHGDHYKTNSQFEVGPKVVRSYAVRRSYSGPGFQVIYDRQQNITALDNVFHALDGKGSIAKSYHGPLTDAIVASQDGTGETEYFKFRCFKNHNLHLTFKRLDLVAKLNQVAGGMRLRQSS
jgi:hypothetical protein